MKSSLVIFFYLVLIAIVVNSCSIQKRKYSKGFYISKHQGAASHMGGAVKLEKVFDTVEKNDTVDEDSKHKAEKKVVIAEVEVLSEVEYVADQEDTLCDLVVFRDQQEVKCVVLEVNPETIRYKKCGFEEGPIVAVRRTDVSSIEYRNGDVESFDNKEVTPFHGKQIEGFGIASVVLGVFALFVPTELILLVVFMAVLSMMFGFASLSRLSKEPDKYYGKAFAVLGLIIASASLILLTYFYI